MGNNNLEFDNNIVDYFHNIHNLGIDTVGNFGNNKDTEVVVFGILGILHIHFQL